MHLLTLSIMVQVLTNCAFVKDFLGFHRCIFALMKGFDLRLFFGGMSMYHDSAGMARTLGIPGADMLFASDFAHGMNGDADPLMLPSKLPSSSTGDNEICMSLRVWDALLWFAIMGRPRRDVSVMADFCKTLTQYSMQLLPRSIFPYDTVPMTRTDAVNETQVFMDMQYELDDQDVLRIPRPLVIPRPIDKDIVLPNFKLKCGGKIGSGVLEDEMFMSEIIMMSDDIGIKSWSRLPLHIIPSMNIFWEYGVCFPLIRYTEASSLSHEVGSSKNVQLAFVFLHPVRFSMMLWAMDSEDEDKDTTDEDWLPQMVCVFNVYLLYVSL